MFVATIVRFILNYQTKNEQMLFGMLRAGLKREDVYKSLKLAYNRLECNNEAIILLYAELTAPHIH